MRLDLFAARRKKQDQEKKQERSAQPTQKSWAEEMGLPVPPKPDDPRARQQADEHIAQGTYHLKRGNREKDPEKKVRCFEEALQHFEALQKLVPNDTTVAKQVEMISRGLAELRTALEHFRATHPDAIPKG